MHWRRLNLNELNGELKSLGGFLPVSPFFACWTDAKKWKKTQPTNQPQPTPCPTQSVSDKGTLEDTIFFLFSRFRLPGGRLSNPFIPNTERASGVPPSQHTLSPRGPLTCLPANSLFVLSLLGRGRGPGLSVWCQIAGPSHVHHHTPYVHSTRIQQ